MESKNKMCTRKFKMISVLALVLFITGMVQAQTGWGFQQYFIPAGSQAAGYTIVTAVVPQGSYISSWGSTFVDNGNGTVSRVAALTYTTPLSPTPQPTETHLFIAGVCQSIKAPSGYRKLNTYRNIYGLDNPDTGSFDQSTEFCIVEIVPR